MKKTELAQDYFERHTDSNECFITSDHRVFHQSGAALSHARGLDDKDVESFNRDDVKAEQAPAQDASAVISEETKAKVLAFDPENFDFNEAKELAKSAGLKPGTSKESVKNVLVELQSTLKA